MATPNFSAILPEVTQEQIVWLGRKFGINKTQIVITAVRLLYEREMKKTSHAASDEEVKSE